MNNYEILITSQDMSKEGSGSESYNKTGSSSSSSPTRSSSCTFCGFRPLLFCILVFELCERLCFYSIQANFVEFSKKYLSVDNATAMNFSLIFTGVIYLLCFVTGWISDALLGRYKMILWSGVIYLFGLIILTSVTIEISQLQSLTVLENRVFTGFAVIMIAFGTGGIKTAVGPFGAQQLDNNNENLTRLFFIWFYWFTNIGSTVSFTVVAYIQEKYGFFEGLLIPNCALVLAMAIFLVPFKYYRHDYNINNAVNEYFGILYESIKRRSQSNHKYPSLMDYARLSNGGSYQDKSINGLLRIRNIFPILLTFIPFYTAYSQMQSTYYTQSEHLNLNVTNEFAIPVASLNIIDTIVIIIVIPVMAVLVYPCVRYCIGHNPKPLQRIGFGLFLSALSMIAAGILEIIRKHDMVNHGVIEQTVFKNTYNITSISVLTQIPQFFLIASGEVFAAATGLEFAYSQSPASQRSLVSGLFYVMMGTGMMLGTFLMTLVNINSNNQWLNSDIDKGHYEWFFFLLAGIIFLDILIFMFFARKYKYVDNAEEFEETKPLIISFNKYTEELSHS